MRVSLWPAVSTICPASSTSSSPESDGNPQQPCNVWQLHQSSCTPVRPLSLHTCPLSPLSQSSGNTQPQSHRTHKHLNDPTHTYTHPNYLTHTHTPPRPGEITYWLQPEGYMTACCYGRESLIQGRALAPITRNSIAFNFIISDLHNDCSAVYYCSGCEVFKHIIIRLCYFGDLVRISWKLILLLSLY